MAASAASIRARSHRAPAPPLSAAADVAPLGKEAGRSRELNTRLPSSGSAPRMRHRFRFQVGLKGGGREMSICPHQVVRMCNVLVPPWWWKWESSLWGKAARCMGLGPHIVKEDLLTVLSA